MGPLKLWTGGAAGCLLLLASCGSLPQGPVAAPVSPIPQQEPQPEPAEPIPPVPESLRAQTGSPAFPDSPVWIPSPWPVPTPLDLDSWPFGWVSDPETTRLLDLPERFWSDQKPLWRQFLDSQTPDHRRVSLGEAIARAGSSEEVLRASWLISQAYARAGLGDQTRKWLDRAAGLVPSPVIALERAWDQGYRLGDLAGARALWPGSELLWPDLDRQRKARLLRQKLFGGVLSLSRVGADSFVSAQILDRDDLWASTWNGAVVRWSLTTDQLDLVLPAGEAVAPIKLLAATGWFLYAFQEHSLLRYSKVTGTWRSFPYPPGWTGLRVQGAVVEGEESLWVAHLGQGLWRWEKGLWTLVDEGGGGPFLNALASDGQGGFWVGTKDRGLWSWSAGLWRSLPGEAGREPVNVSVIEPDPTGQRWLVGTWGEGTWILEQGRLARWSEEPDYVTAAAWTERGPLWGALDVGLVQGRGSGRTVLGVLDGLPPGGVSSLVTWSGRWIWGTTGQGWGWWTEYENPALLR